MCEGEREREIQRERVTINIIESSFGRIRILHFNVYVN